MHTHSLHLFPAADQHAESLLHKCHSNLQLRGRSCSSAQHNATTAQPICNHTHNCTDAQHSLQHIYHKLIQHHHHLTTSSRNIITAYCNLLQTQHNLTDNSQRRLTRPPQLHNASTLSIQSNTPRAKAHTTVHHSIVTSSSDFHHCQDNFVNYQAAFSGNLATRLLSHKAAGPRSHEPKATSRLGPSHMQPIYTYLSIYLSIYVSIYLSIYLSIYTWPRIIAGSAPQQLRPRVLLATSRTMVGSSVVGV